MTPPLFCCLSLHRVIGILEDWWKLFTCFWIRVTENRIFDLLAWLGIFKEALHIFGKHFGLDAGRVTVAQVDDVLWDSWQNSVKQDFKILPLLGLKSIPSLQSFEANVPAMTNDPDHLMEVQRRARESAQRMLDSLKDAQPGTSTRFYSDGSTKTFSSDGSSTEMKHKPKPKRWWRKS